MDPILLDQSTDLWRVLISAPIMYLTIVLVIRLSGKRATSQMNNFDWIVTVAIGSLVGSGLVLKGVTVIESVAAISMLLILQWLLTKSVLHFTWISRLVKAEPVVLLENGKFHEKAMRRERVTKREVMSAIRQKGLVDPDQVQWAVLEPNASFSVIAKNENLERIRALEDVDGIEAVPQVERSQPS
jgi:uncharacterized membrane protein YcaP (DUF421 family)